MADIAFLLLIFFLVTTTMDKDMAYMRAIPKRIENPEPPLPIEKRNICLILANSQNQLMVRGELMTDPDEISEKVKEFYTANEKVNDPKNKFPMYSTISMSQIEQKILQAEKELEETENTPDVMPEIVEFKQAQWDKWVKKKEALEMLGKPQLREIHFQAHVRIEVQKNTSYELFTKIHSELREAIFDLRDEVANDLFGESYGVIHKRYISNEGDKDKQVEASEDKKKIDLLKILYPDRFIEVTPKK